MLNYLRAKREALEAQKKEAPIVDEGIEKAVEEYRAKLYKEREEQVNEHNKAIDAKLELLDELTEEVNSAMEAEVEAEIAVETEQKEVEYL